MIREWPHVYLHAENHVVYKSAPGALFIDITPSTDPTEHPRLFLPDDQATFDFGTEVGQSSKRCSLRDYPLIEQFFAAAEKVETIRQSIPARGNIRIPREMNERLEAAKKEKANLSNNLFRKYRNTVLV